MTQEEFRERYDFNIKTDNIGGGSFGTVYKAYDNVLDREVAIKVSEVKNIGDKEFSLLEEYKAIENLSEHQNIANYEKVYRFESFPATYDYGIMQYYSLGNLSQYLKNNEVSLEKRESITKGILEGIAFLHQHKVVHRDLKPSNILVVDRRGQIIPKITDFGLSKQAESDGKASRFTNSFAGGTLQYSSPEQLKGLPLKLNTDLWSFGAIAYEIITSKTLFEADSEGTASAEWQNSITQKILHSDISSELGSLPVVWQKVVTACLERDVNKRIQNTKVLFSILIGDDIVVKEPIQEKKTLVRKPIKVNEKEVLKPNNDATIIKGIQKKEKVKEEHKEIIKQVVKKPLVKKENPKWVLPSLVIIIIVGVIGYHLFSTDDIKPIETNLVVFKKDDVYGYKQGEKVIIPAKYTKAEFFLNDSAKVTTKDSSFYINKNEKWLSTVNVVENNKKDVEKEKVNNLLAIDKKAWQLAKKKNTKDSYQKYLKEFKNGKYRRSVLAEISNLDKKFVKVSNTENTKLSAKGFYNKGSKYYKLEDYKESAKWYLKASNLGHNTAQLELGDLYFMGFGVIRDSKQAIIWYRKAANQGSDRAQNNLAEMYFNGTGIPVNYVEALKWYRKLSANKQSHSLKDSGLYKLGYMYENGLGVPINYKEALKLYRIASSKGIKEATMNIAYMYENGLGVPINYTKARELFSSLAKTGSTEAKVALKRLENM